MDPAHRTRCHFISKKGQNIEQDGQSIYWKNRASK